MRTIIETERFALRKPLVDPCVVTLDEMLKDVHCMLAKSPELGTPISALVWKIETEPIGDDGIIITVDYTFNAETVWLLNIRQRPVSED